MTNAEKYLKDGIDINKFAYELAAKISRWDDLSYYSKGIEEDILEFFNEQVKPTLTEDERVILRNIDPRECNVIGRDKNTKELYLAYSKTAEKEDREYLFDVIFPTLFQFIKERRRI